MIRKDKLKWFWEEDDFLEPIRQIQKEFNRQFNNLIQPIQTFPIDISETKNEIIVKADLPGFRKNEISVEGYDNKLIISAKSKKEKIDKNENYYKRERTSGEVKRVITLPEEVIINKAKVNFSDGVLEVRLPKKEVKKKKIKLM